MRTVMSLAGVCRSIIATVALGAVLPAMAQQPPLAVVEVARASVESIAPAQRAPGTVVSTLDSLVSAELSGRLVSVAEVGEQVRQGEPIAVIDDHLWQLQLEDDQATISRLQANLDYLQRQQQRLSSLASRNNTAEAELDELRSRREMIAQELLAAKVAKARTEYELSRTRVLAPFDGVIVERRQMPGEYTSTGQPVARLVNTENLEISARAPISVTRFNRAGETVKVSGDHQSAILPIRSLVPVGDARSRLVEVRLAISEGDWIIGEAVRVELANGAGHRTVAVPRDALVLRNNSVHVYRVDADDTVHKIAVRTGDGRGSMVGISGDIAADDRVVVLGAESLRDGQTVKVLGKKIASR